MTEPKYNKDNPHPLFNRKTELIWEGKYDEYGNRREIDIAGCAFPMQKIETIDQPRSEAAALGKDTLDLFQKTTKRKDDFRNKLIWGDNKLVMASLLQEFKGKVDLIYIDPPFDVGADFRMKVPIGDGRSTTSKDQSVLEMVAYNDTWGHGTDSYLHMIYERLVIMRELLSESGSIYVHCDWRINGFLRAILDELFSNFKFAEIIWVCGLMGHGSFFPKSHETILCYKSPHAKFNSQPRLGLSKRITNALVRDEDGWYYTRGRESSGGSTWLKTYVSKNGELSKDEAIEEANKNRPQAVWSVWMGKTELAKSFNDHPTGTYAFRAVENVNYTTQKPEALLDRISKLHQMRVI